MLGPSYPRPAIRRLLIATLVLLSALALVPSATQAQPDCAVAKLAEPGEPPAG
jgi:hypothetical protein